MSAPDVPVWTADEAGAAIHVPDPSGLTDGTTVILEPITVQQMFTVMRAAQLGANTAGDL